MPLKMKTLIGLYIAAVLIFSGISEAKASSNIFENSGAEIGFSSMSGTVFELNGYLYFESDSHEALLVHSSNFSFFKNLELPVQVDANSIVLSQKNGFSSSLRTVRFVTDTIIRSGLL